MPPEDAPQDLIDAHPTKEFFVDMIVRDISLEQAVLDLVDNCVDGARRGPAAGDLPLAAYRVAIAVNGTRFEIVDNCGGFDKATAKEYAFRFGRPSGLARAPGSIGQFGIGMKRALFKFGNHFEIRSATAAEKWAVNVDVQAWEKEQDWTFPWAESPEGSAVSEAAPGTEIVVDNLRPEVAARFGTVQFSNAIENLIKSKHRQFISQGLSISVNGRHVAATSLALIFDDRLKPGVDRLTFKELGNSDVVARIVAGVGDSVPSLSGWYVVCNGRVVLEADRSRETGWGLIEEETDEILIPKFHNQFARFRGIVWFDSEDSARVPWNTMKTDVDSESPVWQQTFVRMIEMMRPVIDFLNELNKDIQENTSDGSALYDYVSRAVRVNTETLREKRIFNAPHPGEMAPRGPRTTAIQYSKPVSDIEFLQDALNVHSAKAVGERTFELVLRKQKGE